MKWFQILKYIPICIQFPMCRIAFFAAAKKKRIRKKGDKIYSSEAIRKAIMCLIKQISNLIKTALLSNVTLAMKDVRIIKMPDCESEV